MAQKDVELLEAAAKDVRLEGLSYRAAAKKHGVTKSRLHNFATGIVGRDRIGRAGRTSALTYEEEKEIVRCCQILGDFGMGFTRDLVGLVIKHYLEDRERLHQFVDGTPGRKWWTSFMKRWSAELAERRPEHLTTQRARACSSETLTHFYDGLKKLYDVNGFNSLTYCEFASRLWNCDETGISTSATAKRVIVRKGTKEVNEVREGSGKEYNTVLFCGSAAGEQLPPYFLHKAVLIDPRWRVGAPPNSLFGCSDSGWMERANFLEWFEKKFLLHTAKLRETAPVILFIDGHSSHIALDLVLVARENRVILYNLPPNTTHALQPLDVSVFSSAKTEWRKILKAFSLANDGRCAEKFIFASLVNQLLQVSFHPDHFVSGFRKTGIYPLCLNVSSKAAKCLPAERFNDAEAPGQTPVTRHVASYFAVFFKSTAEARPGRAKLQDKIKPRHYGEALTDDDIVARMQEKESAAATTRSRRARTQKKQQKKSSSRVKTRPPILPVIEENDASCHLCGVSWDEEEGDKERELCWVGCDACENWWHVRCAGLSCLPKEEEFWLCPACE